MSVSPYIAMLLIKISIYLEMRFVTKDYFSVKIVRFFQTNRNPLSKQTAFSMIIKFNHLGQLDLVQASLSLDLKFAELKPAKVRVRVHGETSIASGCLPLIP